MKEYEMTGDNKNNFYAFYPKPLFPSLSITGKACAMHCKHCDRHYLEHMIPCSDPATLYRKCLEFDKKGYKGVLVSGGYNENGWVPLEGFVDTLARIKGDTNLAINVHCGLVPEGLARSLGNAGVDVVSFDLIGDDETIREVTGLDKSVEDYVSTLDHLLENVSCVVPHITIGLHGGRLKGEKRAVEIACSRKVSTLVFLVLIPTGGTAFEAVNPPSADEVEDVISYARSKMEEANIFLGCMRPRQTEYELRALKARVNGIVVPKKETLEAARIMGLKLQKIDLCCAVPMEIGG